MLVQVCLEKDSEKEVKIEWVAVARSKKTDDSPTTSIWTLCSGPATSVCLLSESRLDGASLGFSHL